MAPTKVSGVPFEAQLARQKILFQKDDVAFGIHKSNMIFFIVAELTQMQTLL